MIIFNFKSISIKYSIDIMNKLEYEVPTLGNHEFDYGIDQLETLVKLLNCSYISSNYCYKNNKRKYILHIK